MQLLVYGKPVIMKLLVTDPTHTRQRLHSCTIFDSGPLKIRGTSKSNFQSGFQPSQHLEEISHSLELNASLHQMVTDFICLLFSDGQGT